jgi:hypothetical protein
LASAIRCEGFPTTAFDPWSSQLACFQEAGSPSAAAEGDLPPSELSAAPVGSPSTTAVGDPPPSELSSDPVAAGESTDGPGRDSEGADDVAAPKELVDARNTCLRVSDARLVSLNRLVQTSLI